MFQAASSQHEAEKMLQAALSRARKRGSCNGDHASFLSPLPLCFFQGHKTTVIQW